MIDRLQEVCQANGWQITEHELKTKPGSRHWHIQNKPQSGTIEVTLTDDQFAVELRKNRVGPWTEAARLTLLEALS